MAVEEVETLFKQKYINPKTYKNNEKETLFKQKYINPKTYKNNEKVFYIRGSRIDAGRL